MACDMLERCKFPSLDSFQKRSLWTHKEIDLAQHLVIFVIPVGDVSSGTWFPKPGSFFFRVSKQGPCFTVLGD